MVSKVADLGFFIGEQLPGSAQLSMEVLIAAKQFLGLLLGFFDELRLIEQTVDAVIVFDELILRLFQLK